MVAKRAEHPAKSVMDRRWEQRRAEASARRADDTASVVIRREPPTPPSAAAELPPVQHLLADLNELEHSGDSPGSSFLRNTPRAMLVVALIGNTVLLALLYANGFIG